MATEETKKQGLVKDHGMTPEEARSCVADLRKKMEHRKLLTLELAAHATGECACFENMGPHDLELNRVDGCRERAREVAIELGLRARPT